MLHRFDAATITTIETALLTLPLRGGRHGGGAGVAPVTHLLVRVKLSDGTIGNGELTLDLETNGETVEGARVLLESYFSAAFKNMRVEDALQKLWGFVAFNYNTRAALDTALHDALARSQGQVLWDRLAGSELNPVSVCYQLEWSQHGSELEPIFSEVEQIIAQGVHCFKVLLGKDVAKDMNRLELLQQSFGSIDFYVDAQGHLDINGAWQQCEQLHSIGVRSVVDPLPNYALKERISLKEENILPIIASRSCLTPEQLKLELSFDTFDILAIQPSYTGISRSLEMMQSAKEHARGILVDAGSMSGLGTLYALMLASRSEVRYPCQLSYPLKFSRDTIAPSLHYSDGFVDVTEVRQVMPRVTPF